MTSVAQDLRTAAATDTHPDEVAWAVCKAFTTDEDRLLRPGAIPERALMFMLIVAEALDYREPIDKKKALRIVTRWYNDNTRSARMTDIIRNAELHHGIGAAR